MTKKSFGAKIQRICLESYDFSAYKCQKKSRLTCQIKRKSQRKTKVSKLQKNK